MADDNYTDILPAAAHFQAATRQRLDKTLALLLPEFSRSRLQTLIGNGRVLVDGVPCRQPAKKIAVGQRLSVNLNDLPPADDRCLPEAIPLDICHEDDHLIVINKPPGLVTHPGHGNREGTLQSALLNHHPAADGLPRGGLVHRLDKETSGLIVAAKTSIAQRRLIRQFESRTIGREYLALVHGNPTGTGVIDKPIGKDRQNPIRMTIRTGGKEATTLFSVIDRWPGFALLRCRLKTGRTHQIRVHLENQGLPIVGDPTYRRGARPTPQLAAARQMLHAATLRLSHPHTDEPCEWSRPPPPDMQAVLRQLSGENSDGI